MWGETNINIGYVTFKIKMCLPAGATGDEIGNTTSYDIWTNKKM